MTHDTGSGRSGLLGRRACTAGGGRGSLRSRRLSDILRGRREELGLTVDEVAARLDISVGTYTDWEATPSEEWTEDKLYALVKALEMTDQQGGWLFRLAVDREPSLPLGAPQALTPSSMGPARPSGPAFPAVRVRPHAPVAPPVQSAAGAARSGTPLAQDPGTLEYLRDYAAMMDAVPLPSVLFDRRWDVTHVNPAFQALFQGMGPHPTAMPDQNFLRFVLFHPDAGSVLGDRETSWCLPLLAQLESALERYEDDGVLQAIRGEIADDPIMDAAYRCGLPHWMRATGAAAVHHDGAVRPLHHPDPRWGRSECRIVDETPATLQDRGFTRMTLVLREHQENTTPKVRRGKAHLRAVSGS
ncbi:helix-turn-helix domain-containing protein [Streptomyces sp. NPDC000594]|uniref:helix-turn-helix domain-containing protein n=1 Tax=Streptomyces sp. NPDC000594 TaxID=3154261 RepID=UPI00331E605B